MPATSGSPTQIATSQPTKAALSNTPADQFQSGDLGYVQEELASARCPLFALVQSGGPAVDGLLVLSVYQNATARWVSLTLAASGMIEVANAAALATTPTATLPLGVLAWIDTYRTWARLDSTANAGALIADEVFAADVATRRWVRVETPLRSWATQTVWEVNTTTGNNENSGAAGFPLLTLQEYFRRVPVVAASDTQITCTGPVVLVGTQQSDEGATSIRRVKIKGATATLASGPVAAINAPNIAGNAPANLNVTGIADWTPYLQGVVETTLPSNALSWAVVGRQPAAPVADTGPWATYAPSNAFGYSPTGTNAAPLVGATVRVLSFLSSASGTDLNLKGDRGIAYAIETMDLRTASAWALGTSPNVTYAGCLLRDGGPSGPRSSTSNILVACSWQTGGVGTTAFPSGLLSFYGTTFFRTVTITAEALASCAGATCFGVGFTMGNTASGAGATCRASLLNGGGGCTGLGVHGATVDASVNPHADGVVIRGGARMNCTAATLYGVQAVAGSVGVRVWSEGQFSYFPGNPPITGAAGDWTIGEPAPATIMPPVYAAGAWPAPIALPSTWVTLGAASPGGFQGFAFYNGSYLANAK